MNFNVNFQLPRDCIRVVQWAYQMPLFSSKLMELDGGRKGALNAPDRPPPPPPAPIPQIHVIISRKI